MPSFSASNQRFFEVPDRVNVEMTPYDLTKGRITFRYK